MRKRAVCMTVAAVVLAAAGRAEPDALQGKESVPPAKRLGNASVVTVPLDANGISGWRFLNPRRPANLFKDLEKRIDADTTCSDAEKAEHKALIRERGGEGRLENGCGLTADDLPVDVGFQNKTPDDTFTVKFSVPVRGRVTDIERLIQEARAHAEESFVRKGLTDPAARSLEDLARDATLWRQAFAARHWEPGAGKPDAAALAERQTLLRRAGLLLQIKACEAARTEGEWEACRGAFDVAVPAELKDLFVLLEKQRDIDKRYGILRAGAAPYEPSEDASPVCNLKTHPSVVCDFNLTVPPGETRFLSAIRLSELAGVATGVPLPAITFEVSAYGRARLVRGNGYMTVSALVEEPEGRTTPKLQGAQQVGWNPQPLAISPTAPFDPQVIRTLPSASSLSLEQRLGNRADLNATLSLRENEFGGNNPSLGVNSSVIYLTVHSMTGSQFVVGRMPVTAPGQKIAVNLSGDAASLRRKSAVLSVVRGTTERKVADPTQPVGTEPAVVFEDERITGVAELQNLTLPGAGNVAISLLGLFGESNGGRKDRAAPDIGAVDRQHCEFSAAECDYSFRTVGGDLSFNATKTMSGAFAAYHSWRTGRDDVAGRGTTALATLSLRRNHPVKGTPLRGLNLFAGYGTGDRPGGRNTGYIGETASFAPDLLFIKQLSARMGAGRGLSNKFYVQVGANDQTVSPLAFLARTILQTPDDDLVSRATFLRLHHYRFIEPVFDGRNGGFEIDVVTQVESPRDVKWQLNAGRYFPSDAHTNLFVKAPWTVGGSVTVNVQ